MPDAQSVLGWNIIIELNDDDDEVKSAFPQLWVTCCELLVYVDPWETDPSPVWSVSHGSEWSAGRLVDRVASILVEYCDFMTSISTVSHGFLFCCIFKISQPVSQSGYSKIYRANDDSIMHNWIIVGPGHFRISNIRIQDGIFWKCNRIKIHGIQWKYLSWNHSIQPVYLADILLSPCCDWRAWLLARTSHNSYLAFCHANHFLIDPMPDTLSFFIVTHQASSVHSYMSGIISTLEPFYPDACKSCASPLISHTLTGLKCMALLSHTNSHSQCLTSKNFTINMAHHTIMMTCFSLPSHTQFPWPPAAGQVGNAQ